MCSLQEHIERDIRARKSAADELTALGQEIAEALVAGLAAEPEKG